MNTNLQPIDIYSEEYNKNRSFYEDTFDLNVDFPCFYEEVTAYVHSSPIKKWLYNSQMFQGRFCLLFSIKDNTILSYPVFFKKNIDQDTCFVVTFDQIQNKLLSYMSLKKGKDVEYYEFDCYDRNLKKYSKLHILLQDLCKICSKKKKYFVNLNWKKELQKSDNCIRKYFVHKKIRLCLLYDAIVRKVDGTVALKNFVVVDQDIFKILKVHKLNCFSIVCFEVNQSEQQRCFYQLQNEIKDCNSKLSEMMQTLNALEKTKFDDPVFGWACYPFCFKRLKHVEDMLNIRVKWLELFI